MRAGRRRSANCVLQLLAAAWMIAAGAANAVDTRHFSFAYDQPHATGYGVAADTFGDKLGELSKGTLVIDQFPGAQLGQEPQMLQKIRTGDIDFMISSTANAATVSPQSGVLSIHYIFRSEDHLRRAIASPNWSPRFGNMFAETVKEGHVLALATLGLRNLYGKKEIHRIEDIDGVKVRVQATPTEDTMFPAYGAQTVHMPFGNVYTVVADRRRRHGRERHQRLPDEQALRGRAGHVADRARGQQQRDLGQRQGLDRLQRRAEGLGAGRGRRGGARRAGEGARARAQIAGRSKKVGVKFVDVDKSGFIKVAEPIQDRLAEDLGPHAVKILKSCVRSSSRRRSYRVAVPLVLETERHLKWPALDIVERMLDGAVRHLPRGFSIPVFLDVLTRSIGHPWLWLQEVTSAFFTYGIFTGTAVATRRNDHLYPLGDHGIDARTGATSLRGIQPPRRARSRSLHGGVRLPELSRPASAATGCRR